MKTCIDIRNITKACFVVYCVCSLRLFACAQDLLEVKSFLKDFGSTTLAYSTIQPGMKYFIHEKGYIAYDMKWGVQYVLGDPVADPEHREKIVDSFLKKFPRPCFCEITRTTAEILARKGFTINEMGPDLIVDLPTYDFSGKSKEKFRQAARKLAVTFLRKA